MIDQLGVEHKTYKDYVKQATSRGETDISYKNLLEGKQMEFCKWEKERLYKDEEGNYN